MDWNKCGTNGRDAHYDCCMCTRRSWVAQARSYLNARCLLIDTCMERCETLRETHCICLPFWPELSVRTTSLKTCLWRMFCVLLSLSALMPAEGWRSFLKTAKGGKKNWSSQIELFPNPLDLSRLSFWEIFQRKKMFRKGSSRNCLWWNFVHYQLQQERICHNVRNYVYIFLYQHNFWEGNHTKYLNRARPGTWKVIGQTVCL